MDAIAMRRPKAESKKLPDVDGALGFDALQHAGVKAGARGEFVIHRRRGAKGAEHRGVTAHGGYCFAAFRAFGQVGCGRTFEFGIRFREHLFEAILN